MILLGFFLIGDNSHLSHQRLTPWQVKLQSDLEEETPLDFDN